MALYMFEGGGKYSANDKGIIEELKKDGVAYKVLGFADVAGYRGGIPLVRNKPLFDSRGNRNEHLRQSPEEGSKLIAMTVNEQGKHIGPLTEENTIITPPLRSFR